LRCTKAGIIHVCEYDFVDSRLIKSLAEQHHGWVFAIIGPVYSVDCVEDGSIWITIDTDSIQTPTTTTNPKVIEGDRWDWKYESDIRMNV